MGTIFNRKIIIFSVFMLTFSLFALPPVNSVPNAYADGLTQENLPPASVGDRDASLFVKINPPILTEESREDAFMQFRLFDANNNQTIQAVTYEIAVFRGLTSTGQPLLRDFFYAHEGLLTIRINPRDIPQSIVYGTREGFLQAITADPGGFARVDGPVLLEGGLYHFAIRIFTIDNVRNLFTDADAPRFDSYLSVGDISTEPVPYNGQTFDTEIVSYYDQIGDFQFDEQNLTMSWSMPFDWNTTRLQETNIFVHEEVRIPVAFSDFAGTNTFEATVNGFPLEGRTIAVDPFSSPEDLIIHYLISKSDLVTFSQQVAEGAEEMQFTLSPAGAAEDQTTSEMTTDLGGIGVNIDWQPDDLNADTESTINLSFSDAHAGSALDADVRYNLVIYDQEGAEVFRQDGLTAVGAEDVQQITFPANETYRMEVEVTGLVEDGRPVDTTRNGVARGIVVVPEFPAGVLALVAGLLGAIMVWQRFSKRKNL